MSTISNRGDARSRFFEADYSQTCIEGTNIKKVPAGNIITRRINEAICSVDVSGSHTDTNLMNSFNSTPSSVDSSSKNYPENEDIFRSIKFENRKIISNRMTNSSKPTSPNETKMSPMMCNGHITDSIDKTIIENNDLKRIFIRSYNIDVKNIDDFLTDKTSKSTSYVPPKPPRLSLDVEKKYTDEIQGLQSANITNEKTSQLQQSVIH